MHCGWASGKSLCFNVPVLQAVLHPNAEGEDSVTDARAIYMYPTKALAQVLSLLALLGQKYKYWLIRSCAGPAARAPQASGGLSVGALSLLALLVQKYKY